MSEEYKNRLKGLLRNLFQFDSADLDFGIYRIMNKKRNEIERFIDKDLIEAVDAELGKYADSKQSNIKDDFEAIKAQIREKLGDDALDENENIKKILVTTPFAKELDERYKKARASMKNSEISSQHEAEIFTHIYQFFSGYYDNGDFMSRRRYSLKEKYAIPYNGEEVVLHWANKDQYYIKTGEYFKNYSFKIGDYAVEFRILDAEGTINNNKAESRFFVPSSSDPAYDATQKLLTIYFEYRGLSSDEEKVYGTKNVQDAIITKMKDAIPSQVQEEGLKAALNKIVDKETEKTILEKHLKAYTQRNTTDYFIHKALKGFLTQELDFYIKNEVLHLDYLGTENEVGVVQYLSRAKVIKSICLKIIDFLAQIEDFQRILFEKKKFVVRTDYCMTLDNVPTELYPVILKNKDQINEWKTLYAAGEEKQSTITSFGSKSIDEAYLKEHPYLALDTKFFDREFKDKLLESFDDLDEATGGIMIKSENWQALNLMQEKYREKVKCTYIDPPYNTGSDEFIYKDSYQHSSWLAMMIERLSLGQEFLSLDGIFFVSSDDHEVCNLRFIMNEIFGEDNFLAQIVVQSNKRGQTYKQISKTHEYVLIYTKNPECELYELEKEGEKDDLNLIDDIKPFNIRELRNRNPKFGKHNRPNLFYEIYVNPSIKDKDGFSPVSLKLKEGYNTKVEPYDSEGRESCWRWGKTLLEKNINEYTLKSNVVAKQKRDGGFNIYEKYRKTTYKAKSIWTETEVITEQGTMELGHLGLGKDFDFPKPVGLIKNIIKIGSETDEMVFDFFAGSGTTAQAVLNFNKENGDNRKYILVEMGDYLDTIMKPRIQKVMYSKDWKDGKSQSSDGISHIFKYQCLEQYEDTLNNIEFKDAGSYQRTLSEMDGYFLRYMLDFETRESSPCRFNVEKLTKPFDYTLRITHGNEMKDEKVDMVETFNYLLGIYVKQIRTFNNNGTYYKAVFGRKNEDEIAIVWRNTENLDLKALQADKAFIEGTILSGIKPSKIYINANFYVEGALPIEPEFKKLMVV